jgi:hypothetical protein
VAHGVTHVANDSALHREHEAVDDTRLATGSRLPEQQPVHFERDSPGRQLSGKGQQLGREARDHDPRLPIHAAGAGPRQRPRSSGESRLYISDALAPERDSKAVCVGPGQSAVTLTPLPDSSAASPRDKDRTNALVA